MRDFRDAKAMAHTIRAALAANGLKITISQSLELIAKAFGLADWNTLSAAISADPGSPRQSPPVASPSTADGQPAPEHVGFSAEMAATLQRAVGVAPAARLCGAERIKLKHNRTWLWNRFPPGALCT